MSVWMGACVDPGIFYGTNSHFRASAPWIDFVFPPNPDQDKAATKEEKNEWNNIDAT